MSGAIKTPAPSLPSPPPTAQRRMTEDMGHDVIIASSGHEGLQAIERRPEINLVLSDVIMAGGMNGPEMAQKALSVRPELKVLFMSDYAPVRSAICSRNSRTRSTS